MPERRPNVFKISQHTDRRAFIGGSDARIIMGADEPALLRLKSAVRQSRRTFPANPVQLSLVSARVQKHPLAPFVRRTSNSSPP
jgi:hypothetical protein